MNKTKIRLTLLSVALLALFITSNMALASETTGILTTGEVIVIVAPTANPGAGTYDSVLNVVLTAAGATIHYTIDGTTPDCSKGTVYSNPISVGSSMVIEAISCYSNGQFFSTVASYLYAINIPATTPAPSGGGSYTPPVTATSTLSAAAQKVDANKDNKIDVLDFNTLMVNWGKTAANNVADFNSDDKVDIFDFNLLMINWTK